MCSGRADLSADSPRARVAHTSVVSTSRHVRWYPRTSPSENRSAVSPHEPAFAARAPLETRALEHGSAVFADVAAAAPTDDLLEGSDLHEARTRWIGCRDGCERVALEPAPRRPARRASALEPVDGVCLESVLRHASHAHPRGPLVHPTEGRAACRRTGDGRSSPPKVGNTRLALSIAECTKSSGNKFPGPPSGFGLNKRLNRRFRKQHGGPLLEGDASRSGRPLGPSRGRGLRLPESRGNRVDKIAFPGSTEVGKDIQWAIAGAGKQLPLELGARP